MAVDVNTAGEEKMDIDTRPSAVKRLWRKAGLDVKVLLMMFKGALPPVVALALFHDVGFTQTFSTLGYLVAIMATLSLAIQPRAKFFQTMVFNITGICIGSAVALLSCYCAVEARRHTAPVATAAGAGPSPGAQTAPYNSSASVVSAVWLFANIMFSNAVRFSRPQFQIPIIMYSIFAMVTGIYAPQFASMTQATAFVTRLLEAFLSGYAIASVVNVFVFPVTSRMVVIDGMAGYVKTIRGVLAAQKTYMQSVEHEHESGESTGDGKPPSSEAAKGLKTALSALTALHGKLNGDLVFAKREVGYGKLDAKDLDSIFKLFRHIFLPVLGLGSIVDIFERAAERGGAPGPSTPLSEVVEGVGREAGARKQQRERNEIMQMMHRPVEEMTEAMDQGLTHVAYVLEFAKKPQKAKVMTGVKSTENSIDDVESRGGLSTPGDVDFGLRLEATLARFLEDKELVLQRWCEEKGLLDAMDRGGPSPSTDSTAQELSPRGRNRQQLFFILYMGYLLHSTAEAVLGLVRWADAKTASGAMKRKRIILPGKHRLRKWLVGAFGVEDASNDHAPDNAEAGLSSFYFGDAFKGRKDPEHLPPTNALQKLGNAIRKVAGFMRSPELAFGFRVACATMSIAIVSYLEQTQAFFLQQRLVWAMIMVAIGMTMTSGSGVFGLVGRVVGTTLAAAASLAIWYIAGGNGVAGAVYPVLFVFTAVEVYFLIKFPKFTIISLISIVTQVLILGYELEAQVLGVAALEASGQPYYPIYLLAPYRLATVAAGCFVAFIWTYFPYPITARNTLRRRLGDSLYLLANFYSCVHTTIGIRIHGTGGDPDEKGSPAYRLAKMRTRILGKQLAILAELRQHLAFTKFEFTLGGKFPARQYGDIIDEVQRILNYMSLMSYTTSTYVNRPRSRSDGKWLEDLARLVSSTKVTSHEITSLLTLVSSSVINGTSLPPYLKPPTPFQLTERLEALDPEILSAKHITEPGYAAFAVRHVASRLISEDLQKLLDNVKSLVGEVDFSFHIISTVDPDPAPRAAEKRD